MAIKTINAAASSRSIRNYDGGGYTAVHNAASGLDLSPTLYVIQKYVAVNIYLIYRTALIFDTSSIPSGANISSAVIQIYPIGIGEDKTWNVVVRNGQPTYPHIPVVIGDYLYSHYSGDGGSVVVSTLTLNTWNDITLNATGIDWIQKVATTKLALISSKDISSTAPTGNESIGCSARIVITYTTITISVHQPSDIIRANPTVVTANGYIIGTDGDDITTRGFKYGLTEADTWDESESDSYGEGAFSLQLTGLTADTTYYIRAYVTGSWGTRYSSYLEFKTAYPYGTVITEIKSEKTASDSEIAEVGGKRSLTIDNHLIQTQTMADLIANAYLDEYKDQKTKLVVTKPTPAPYEIGDTIEKTGILPYYPAVFALISYAPAISAEHPYDLAGRDMIIRKLNVSFSVGNYVSIIELED